MLDAPFFRVESPTAWYLNERRCPSMSARSHRGNASFRALLCPSDGAVFPI